MSKEEFSLQMKKLQNKNKQLELREKLKAERNKFKQSKKNKMSTRNKVLITAIVAIILFTAACLYIQYHGVEVNSTLITLWFSFWTVEIFVLAGITVSKIFTKYDNTSNYEQVSSDDDVDAVG